MPKQYEMRKACFACTTPYQVLGAVSIVLEEKIDADIYVFGTFSDYLETAKRLEHLCIFKNVFPVNCDKTLFLGKKKKGIIVDTQAFFQVAFPDHYVSEYLDRGIAYETFYSSSRAHVKILLQRVLQKRNPQMRIVIYDDGLGSYIEESHVLQTSKKRKRIENLLGWYIFNPDLITIQLYLPQIAKIPQELSRCPVSQMPRLDWNKTEKRGIIKAIFGISDSVKYTERIILFDNVRGSLARRSMFEKIDECYNNIISIAGEENVLFKGHPRSVESPSIQIKTIRERGVSMEVFYSEMSDLDSRILIAYNSTAAYTPKMLFNKEPWVINIHRIVGPPLQGSSEALYQTFLPTYEKKEKMLAPNTMEELRQMLDTALKVR